MQRLQTGGSSLPTRRPAISPRCATATRPLPKRWVPGCGQPPEASTCVGYASHRGLGPGPRWWAHAFRGAGPPCPAERFDPDGDYIRRWVPELSELDPPAIFAPWRADPAALDKAGVRLGTDYPHPIVDYTIAWNRALARFQESTSRRS
ncbi:MAG TPA: FAD-binding domain-containing protein [Actinomycetes bacterium]|nr:FAD-binding domain-containing protein [Actinomycetes bacterium]